MPVEKHKATGKIKGKVLTKALINSRTPGEREVVLEDLTDYLPY
ncbi:MAG: hypothetical protein ACR5LA_09705 [Wolbachia sp.]